MDNNKANEWKDTAKDLVTILSNYIAEHPEYKDLNFALFHQNGRLSFMDLDAFSKNIKLKTENDGAEKTLAELKEEIENEEKSIDKD